jgi:hypothetical protein
MAKGGQRYGAGRPGWHVKAEHCRRLDVRRFAREDMLRPGSWRWQWTDRSTGKVLASIGVIGGPDAITLDYTANGAPINQRISIDRTACALGGSRPWFKCPNCWGRVACLYLKQSRFACRACHRLVYASQSEDAIGRAWRKQQKLEALLGENWRRPKGMHRTTRERILEAISECEGMREDALVAFMDRIGFKGW